MRTLSDDQIRKALDNPDDLNLIKRLAREINEIGLTEYPEQKFVYERDNKKSNDN